VPKGIVYVLEMIEIEIENREIALSFTRAIEYAAELGDEHAAISQSRKEVELRNPLEPAFGVLRWRNIMSGRKQKIYAAECGSVE
jgi:hypothetical protein